MNPCAPGGSCETCNPRKFPCLSCAEGFVERPWLLYCETCLEADRRADEDAEDADADFALNCRREAGKEGT